MRGAKTPANEIEDVVRQYEMVAGSLDDRITYELELRSHPTAEVFSSLYKKFISIPGATTEVIQSVIQRQDDMRKEIYYAPTGGATLYKKLRKTPLIKAPLRGLFTNISLSREEVLKDDTILKFSRDTPFILRFRIRVTIPQLPNWYIEFTVVKETGSIPVDTLKLWIVQFFGHSTAETSSTPITAETFLDRVPLAGKQSTMIEAEFKGGSLTPALVRDLIGYFAGETSLGNPEYIRTLRHIATKIAIDDGTPIRCSNIREVVNQPHEISKSTYNEKVRPHISEYFAADKADGDRALVYIIGSNVSIVTHTLDEYTITTSAKSDIPRIDNEWILDCEVLWESPLSEVSIEKIEDPKLISKGLRRAKIYAFDILYFNKSLVKKPYFERLDRLDRQMNALRALINRSDFVLRIDKKPTVRLTADDYCAQIKKIFENKTRTYPIDGLIFTPASGSPFPDDKKTKRGVSHVDLYRSPTIYKWKPSANSTIDFLAISGKPIEGIDPYIPKYGKFMYVLFNGGDGLVSKTLLALIKDIKISRYNRRPVPFSPPNDKRAHIWYSDVDYGKKVVVELVANPIEDRAVLGTWKLYKLRPDKEMQLAEGTAFGNSLKTALNVWENISNPLTIEEMCKETITQKYFAAKKDPRFIAQTSFNSFVKSQILKTVEGAKWNIDLAAGKGQDIYRFSGVHIENCLFVDIDPSAITELNRRLTDSPPSRMRTLSTVWDLSKPAEDTLQHFKDRNIPPAQSVTMFFAIHYLIKSPESVSNIVTLIKSILAREGRFIFTTFNGEKVHRLLKDVPEGGYLHINADGTTAESATPLVLEEGSARYSLQKLYKRDALFEPYSCQIGVLLPFSNGEYYTENLVDIDHIVTTFEENSFEREFNTPFGDFEARFKKENPKVSSTLTDGDRLYCDLYQAVSLWNSAKLTKTKSGASSKKKL